MGRKQGIRTRSTMGQTKRSTKFNNRADAAIDEQFSDGPSKDRSGRSSTMGSGKAA
ncbi:hypothetical protein Dimus_029811, partial [Dionaea muscipula]